MRYILRVVPLVCALLGLSTLQVLTGNATASVTPSVVHAHPAAAASLPLDNRLYSIRATATSRYVSAELGAPEGSYGVLRARATTVGAWERFRFHESYSGPVDFGFWPAENNRPVQTDIQARGAYQGTLQANGTFDALSQGDPAMVYDLVPIGSGDFAIRSHANNRFVSAELGYTGANYGLLRARATTVGAWERFDIRDAGPAPTN
jgi:hypothetical protein